uniref:receptor protein serine/threonine kinase n=1 Tax=Hirondellea gigas TaxID=1518452 RepID=A0A6A7GBD5_9CRUS
MGTGASMSVSLPMASVLLLATVFIIITDGVRGVPVAGPAPELNPSQTAYARIDRSQPSSSATSSPPYPLMSSLPLCHRHSTHNAVILKEEGDLVLPGGERVLCADPADYCFSYWTYENRTDSEGGRTLKWLAQGCFNSPDSCQQSNCAATRQSPDNTFFCCCWGDLCNANVSVPTAMTHAVVSPLRERTKEDFDRGDRIYDINRGIYRFPYWIVAVFVACFVTMVASLFAFTHWKKIQRKSSLQHELGIGGGGERKFFGGDAGGNLKHPAGGGAVGQGCWTPRKASVDVNSVALTELIGKGRFGRVYRAVSGSEDIVVKVFTEQERESYDNELFIYSHPFMDHPNLLTCLGWGSIGPGEYGLVLPYCSGGRLSSYLSQHTLTWPQLCRVAYTATRGLAHLHAPINRHGLEKPSMSHRDFNSRNLVLRADMSCVVIDLGLAVCVKGSNHSRPGRPSATGTPPALNEAGSVRYMAPELLEGAVNLSECEIALRQIDVYALGLVLWECITRCSDLLQEEQPYALPYAHILGPNIRLDQMIETVVRQKQRPAFPAFLTNDTNDHSNNSNNHSDINDITTISGNNPSDSAVISNDNHNTLSIDGSSSNGTVSTNNPGINSSKSTSGSINTRVGTVSSAAVRMLKDTIEECWDADAEARLSALCVAERLANLQHIGRQGDLQHKGNRDNSSGSSTSGAGGGSDEDKDSESGDQSYKGHHLEKHLLQQQGGRDDMFITQNYYTGQPLQNSYDDSDLPAYCENSHHGNLSSEMMRTISSYESSGSGSRRCKQFLLSGDKRARVAGEESSTRTLQTLLSPSASGQPNLMTHTGGYGYGYDAPLCTSAVLQNGSAAPVSVLHPSSPSSAEETRPMIAASTRSHHGGPSSSHGRNPVSNLWSKFMSKIRRGGDSHSNQNQQQQLLSQNPMMDDHHQRNGQVGVEACQNNYADSSTNPNNIHDAHDFNLLRAFMSSERESGEVTNSTENKLEFVRHASENGASEPADRLANTSAGEPHGNASANHNNNASVHNSGNNVVSSYGNTNPNNASSVGSYGNTTVDRHKNTHVDSTYLDTAVDDTIVDSSQRCQTVPVRRHASGKLRPNSRPASLEIRSSPTESITPLNNYLSTSCNFRIPDEIVLRKSKNRVKTPRHPPLPRLSLEFISVGLH